MMLFHGTFELYRYQKLERDDIYKVDISTGLAFTAPSAYLQLSV